MKIAIIRQRYDPYGGAERFIARGAEALAKQGAAVTVVARDWPGEAVQWLRCNPFYVGSLWRDWSFARAACSATSSAAFDLVQSHERIACCDVYRAGDGVHAQWLAHRAGILSPLGRARLRLNPFHRYVLAAERRLFASPRLRAVVCNSRMVREEVRRWFQVPQDKLHVIYNGIDLQAFHPKLKGEHRAGLRARLGIPESATMFLFVGSGFERKGVRQLLAAFARLGDQTAHLAIVGKDRAQKALASEARTLGLGARTHWPGPQDDVRPWYGAADCFALPTLYDPFPNAALEALACGLPVVTTRNCGAAEILKQGWNGYVCRNPSDVDELAANLSRVAKAGQSMGANARATAQRYSIGAMAKALGELYHQLLRDSAALRRA